MSTGLQEPRYPFVAIDVAADDVDEMSGLFFELGAEGVEERDATTMNKGVAMDAGKTTLVGSFGSFDDANEALAYLKAEKPEHNARLEEIVGDAWRDAWKEHFRPFAICQGLVVRPPWETYEAKPGEDILVLEPGRAFGTGLHETTSLVAGELQKHAGDLRGKDLLDVGCGSGILALVALKLGATKARAIDNDPDVIGVVNENAERNGLHLRILADTVDVAAITETFPAVVANIEARVLIPMTPALTRTVKPGGLLVLSGILVPQKDDVVAAYGANGFTLESAPVKGEWIALVFRAPPAKA